LRHKSINITSRDVLTIFCLNPLTAARDAAMARRTPSTDDSNDYDTTIIEDSGNTHFDTEKHRLAYAVREDEYLLFLNDNTDGLAMTVYFDDVVRNKHKMTPGGYRFKRDGKSTASVDSSELSDDMIDLLETEFFDA